MFESTMVKDTASKTFMVRNVGTKATGFELSASKPFSISPSAGHLAVGEVLQCTVNFTPQVDGLSRGELLIRYAPRTCIVQCRAPYASFILSYQIYVGWEAWACKHWSKRKKYADG